MDAPALVSWPEELAGRADGRRLTHHLFRFPAKMYAPAARKIIERYSTPGQTIADPFAGSGTVAIESLVSGRQAVASDVDPLAVYITKAKVTPIQPSRLTAAFDRLLDTLRFFRRSPEELLDRQFADLDDVDYERERAGLWTPEIPSLSHWFRRYVTVDLARVRHAIVTDRRLIPAERRFFMATFAAAIRLSSNADPVPVSGLEVTAYMKERDARGRVIDPISVFERKTRSAILGMAEYHDAVGAARATVFRADATKWSNRYPAADAVITSPPYLSAVDYYRRHTLETYWLGLATAHADRLRVRSQYLGRSRIAAREMRNVEPHADTVATQVIADMPPLDAKRRDSLRHYCSGMARSFRNMARILSENGWLVLVIGDSSLNGATVRTRTLLSHLASPYFLLEEVGSYPIRNRHMSYSRRNGASIDEEWVLAYRRLPDA